MTVTLLQEAAEVAYGASPMITFADGEVRSARFDELSPGSRKHYDEICAALLRWLLTREPTEQMYDAAMDAWPTDHKFSTVYRAMNAALLKEMG